MKICLICPEYPPGPHGGLGTMIQLMAREMVSRGHEVRVIGVYRIGEFTFPEYFEDNGVKVWRIFHGAGKFDWILAWYKLYKYIKDWLKKGEVEIVEAPDSRGWFAFWGKMPIPLVLRANGSATYFSYVLGSKPNKLTKWFEEISYKKADGIIAVSEFTAQTTKKVFNLKQDFEIIHNCIELVDFKPVSKKYNNKIVFSGSLVEKKGIVSLVKACIVLSERGVNFSIDIYGKDTVMFQRGSMVNFLKTLIPKEYLTRFNFMLHVNRETLFKAYREANVAIFPSYAEAFAFAPMEAMMCGCPTIYSKEGSGPELIRDGVDGLLVNPDVPLDIANALEKLLSDNLLRSQLGERGRNRIENKFITPIMVNKSLKFYEKQIGLKKAAI
jgi:glycosyltransferase involved in cell wall biosynthesis